jgi:predicted DNA binding protein
MSLTVTLHLEHDRMALVPTLSSLEDVAVEVVPQGNTNPGTSEFPFHVECPDRRAVEREFDADTTVNEYELIEWDEASGLYYIEHSPETVLISSAVSDANGYLVHTESDGEGWLVRLLLPDRAALNSVWEYAIDQGISLDIIEIYRNENAGAASSYGLTDEQRAALVMAYEKGYFVEPREMSLDALADEMDLSSTAMSGRLRRGMRNLIAATLVDM